MAQIQFIPNDPLAGSKAPNIRKQVKRKNRPASRASFALPVAPPAREFEPGTPEFLFWQCREASLAALDAWETFAGPHTRWQGNRKKIHLLPDAGSDLNAFYDRSSFSFFHFEVGSKTVFSGSSTDVVAHEVGHGLLDTLRPDLWDATFLESGAFHEAFGDCVALLTALDDAATRKRLLAVKSALRKRNFVESTAEELSDAVRRLDPTNNAAEPRRAFNAFQYQLPSTLPFEGPPGALINEVHSFGMLFSGCIWDLVAGIFADSAGTSANLLAAAQTTGRLLVEGSKTALLTPRFFQSIGRSMVLADDALNGGEHREHVKKAFANHGILLGSSAILTPTAALAGAAPSRGTPLHASTRKDLLNRLGAKDGERLSAQPADLFGQRVTRAVLHKEVDLGAVHKRLAGVVAVADVPVIVGGSGKRATIVGNMPEPVATDEEVQSFVKSLLAHDQIDFGNGEIANGAARRGAVRASGKNGKANGNGHAKQDATATHAIVTTGRKRVLQRIRFH